MKLKSSVSFLSIEVEHVNCHSSACLRNIGTGKKVWSTCGYTKHGDVLQLIPLPEFVKPAQACCNIMKIKL
jgi:hypothetical protein